MKHPAAPLLAQDLGRLPHTNNRGEKGWVHVPGFINTAGMSQEQAGEAGLLALAIAEGIIEDLGSHSYQVLHDDEIAAKAKALAADEQHDGTGHPVLHCHRCLQPVMTVNTRPDLPKVDVRVIMDGLQAHLETCQ